MSKTSERQPMGVQDALWLEMDRPSNLMVVDALMWTAEPIDWDRFTPTAKERLWDRYRVFRSRAVHDDDSWHWEECTTDSFDADFEHIELPAPGGDVELQEFIASQRTEPLDRDRPLWTMFLIDGFKGGSAVLTRTHHAIADGIRMVQLAMSLFDATPEGGPILAAADERLDATDGARTAAPRACSRRGRGGCERAGRSDEGVGEHGRPRTHRSGRYRAGPASKPSGTRSATSPVQPAVPSGAPPPRSPTRSAPPTAQPRRPSQPPRRPRCGCSERSSRACRATARSSTCSRRARVTSISPGSCCSAPATTRRSGPARSARAKVVAWSEPLPLAAVKDVAHAHGATVNDVLVTCVAGTLHTYLDSHDSSCASVNWMIPVNLAPLDVTLPEELGNNFAVVQLELPTDTADPLAVLDVVKHRMGRIKSGHEAGLAFRLQELISGFSDVLYRASVDLLANRAVGVLTNVPGPPIPVYVAGCRVEGMVGWAPLSGNQSMSFTIYSYDGNVFVGIACDADLVPDHDQIVDGFAAAFHRLSVAVR